MHLQQTYWFFICICRIVISLLVSLTVGFDNHHAQVNDCDDHACSISQHTDSFAARVVACLASFFLGKARKILVIWNTKKERKKEKKNTRIYTWKSRNKRRNYKILPRQLENFPLSHIYLVSTIQGPFWCTTKSTWIWGITPAMCLQLNRRS